MLRKPAAQSDLKEKWEKEFANYPNQLEIALDTNLRFGNEKEIWFNFRDKTIRWINQTEDLYTVLIVPVSSDDRSNYSNYRDEYELAMRFVSRLAFEVDTSIDVILLVVGPRRLAPTLNQPKKEIDTIYPDYYGLVSFNTSSAKEDLAYAFYKEGLNSSSVHYSFLCFYKVIQLSFDENDAQIKNWINNNLDPDKLKHQIANERVQELQSQGKNVAVHILGSGRIAIAHAKPKGIKAVDPDDPNDRLRLTKELPIVKGLAKYAIKQGLFKIT